jgi:hypothetical protein
VSNLKISRQNEESERAFQAAEAGISQVLQTGSGENFRNLSNEATFSTSAIRPGNTSFMLNGGELVDQATGFDVWLSKYPNFDSEFMNGQISIYWGTENHTAIARKAQKEVRPSLRLRLLSFRGAGEIRS